MSNQTLSGRFKSERIPWTDKELRITLGYYFFVYEYNTRKHNYELFTIHLRKMTGNNRAFGSVGVRFGNYNSVNPKKSGGFKGGDKKCKPIWDSCINADGTPKKNFIIEFMDFVQTFGCNNKIYDPFTKKYKQYINFAAKAIDDDDAEEVMTTLDVDQGESFGAPEYKKEPKPKATDVVSKKYSRDAYRAKKAIFNSKYECNIDNAMSPL